MSTFKTLVAKLSRNQQQELISYIEMRKKQKTLSETVIEIELEGMVDEYPLTGRQRLTLCALVMQEISHSEECNLRPRSANEFAKDLDLLFKFRQGDFGVKLKAKGGWSFHCCGNSLDVDEKGNMKVIIHPFRDDLVDEKDQRIQVTSVKDDDVQVHVSGSNNQIIINKDDDQKTA